MDAIKIEVAVARRLEVGLLEWFRVNKRDLPWRSTYDPYHVWVSEVMLQQTQMERGVQYFRRWVDQFPDIKSVATASEQEILKAWEGLGYYSRARNLQAAAKILDKKYGGIIPCDPEVLQTLPGVGPYTAAAVSSIACNCDVAVIDANVERVYGRIFDMDCQLKSGAGKRLVAEVATSLLPSGQARNFNQALMEFGGIHCLPRKPLCDSCPVREDCLAFLRGTVPIRPVLGKKNETIHIEMATGILVNNGRLFIQQRRTDDIWGGLWEFPGGQLEKGESPEEALVREFLEETGYAVDVEKKITTVTHGYMHYRVVLHCFVCWAVTSLKEPVLTAARDFAWVSPAELKAYGFPAGHRKLLEYMERNCPDLLTQISCSQSR